MSKTFTTSFFKDDLDEQLRVNIDLAQEKLEEYYEDLAKGNNKGIIAEDLFIQSYCASAQELIERGANVNNKSSENGFTLAHIVACVGNINLLRFLIERGTNIYALDNEGQSLLHMAVTSGDVLVVLTVLDAINVDKSRALALINQANNHGDTALHYATMPKQDSSIARMMLLEGADYNLQNVQQISPLALAQKWNHAVTQTIEAHIANARKDEAKDGAKGGGSDEIDIAFGRATLFLSIRKLAKDLSPKRLQEIDDFVARSLNKLAKLAQDAPKENGTNPAATRILTAALKLVYFSIHTAAQDQLAPDVYAKHLRNMQDMLKMTVKVIDAGADVNLKSYQGFTALHFAAYFKSQEVVNDLVARYANLKDRDDAGNTPIYYGSMSTFGSLEKIKFPNPPKIAKIEEDEKEAVEITPIDPATLTKRLQFLISNLPPRLGSSEINGVEDLVRSGADVNAKVKDDSSILHSVIKHKDGGQIVRFLLTQDSLEPSSIFEEIAEVIKSGNPQLVSNFLNEEKVISKFSNLEKTQQSDYLKAWKDVSKKADITKKISGFRNAVSEKLSSQKSSPAEADINEAKEGDGIERISKAEKERRRKAANKIKAEEEAKATKILEEKRRIKAEIKAEVEDVSRFGIEGAISRITQIIEEKKEAKFAKDESVTSDSNSDLSSSSDSKANSISPPAAPLSSKAAEFIPVSVKKLAREQEEMQTFLRGPRQIKSVDNLPPFLQPSFSALLQNGHRVLLKGSAVYQAVNSARPPQDLDVEILVKGMSTWQKDGKWDDDRVKNFVQNYFDIAVDKIKIYRGPNNDNSVFTVNVKDEARKLDISLYDRQKEPPAFLRWTVSREEKVFFDQDGQARNVKPSGFAQHLRENRIHFNPRQHFMINPDARGLISRLCFLKTIGHIKPEETDIALQAIAPNNLADLLFREMKVDFGQSPENQKKHIQKKIADFATSHAFDKNLQSVFISNMSRMVNDVRHMYSADTRNIPQYQPMYQAIDEMKEACFFKPSVALNASVISNLDKTKSTVLGKSFHE